jgi:hypothetical protein
VTKLFTACKGASFGDSSATDQKIVSVLGWAPQAALGGDFWAAILCPCGLSRCAFH